MKKVDIIEKKKDNFAFLTLGETRYIGQILVHKYIDDYEYTKIWVGNIPKDRISIKMGDNALFFVKFDVEDNELIKNLEIKHERSFDDYVEAVLFDGQLTIFTKYHA